MIDSFQSVKINMPLSNKFSQELIKLFENIWISICVKIEVSSYAPTLTL